ncbi:MAG: methionine--tRNA ligase [bacterium]|nr:methionine--tRNA ligase [Candidatus Kapabacteria bacterium]
MSHSRTLVTSALPYANGYIHIGHVAGAYLPADMYTRFLRACGEEVIHVSGSDEHGVAIEISADQEGVSPRDIIDKYHQANEQAFRELGIDFDVFGRTSWPEHHQTAKEFFLALHERGYLVEKEEEQFYDAEAGKFLPDRFVEGTCPNCGTEGARGDQCDTCSATYNQTELINPISVLSGKTPELRRTRHLYLRLGAFQERLESYIASHEREWRDHVVQQAKSWLKAGLGDRSITRDLSWGIDVPLPGYEGKKLYVWFDAPIGYITNTKILAREKGDPDGWKRWWCDSSSRYVAFIGKDNIVFHTLIFPAMLMGRSEDSAETFILPDNVPANEFLNLEGRKLSKSRRWSIDLADYLASYPPDPLRYTIAAGMPENKDTDFSWREYQARTNNELADILGNFVNRTMQFATRYFDGVVPPLVAVGAKENEMRALLSEDLRRASSIDDKSNDEKVLDDLTPKYLNYLTRTDLVALLAIARAPVRIGELYRSFHFREAVLETMNLARAANKYFNDSEPWKTRTQNPARAAASINICLQMVRSLAIVFEPIVPHVANGMWKMLGRERVGSDGWASAADIKLESGGKLGEPGILVQKVEDETVEREVAKLMSMDTPDVAAREPVTVELKEEISIDDVMRLDLRVATIIAAERVKKSSKLLKLQIRIGNLERQIVAGIGKAYEPDAIVGRKIVVVANLKPATLMGQESQGMLLAANPPEGAPTLVGFIDGDIDDGWIVR